MQIAPLSTSSGIVSGGADHAGAVVEPLLTPDSAGETVAEAAPAAPPAAPLKRGLNNWDHRLQGEISSAQQALDFLEQSAGQLQALKNELVAKLDARQGRDGQVEARVRQFSDTWRNRQRASGGTLDSQLSYSSPQPSSQRFTIRGLNMANLQAGGKEVLAFTVGGSSQSLSSVNLEPGLSQEEIVKRFDQAMAPANIRVSLGENNDGSLVFSTPESSWASVRDTLAVRGSGIRFPTGQMNRVRTDEEAPALEPENWQTGDTEALRNTLRQVVMALAQVQMARSAVNRALAAASNRVETAALPEGVSMDRLASNFSSTASNPDYQSMREISSSLVGISRERVVSLLGLR